MSDTEPNKPLKKRVTAWMSPNEFTSGQSDAKMNMANQFDQYGIHRFLYKNYWLLLTVSLLFVLSIGGYGLYYFGAQKNCPRCGNKFPVYNFKKFEGEQLCPICIEKVR